MNIWIIETGEPMPTDGNVRLMRCGILASTLLERGHEVVWWASTFDHARKIQRAKHNARVTLSSGLHIRFLYGPSYTRNVTPARLVHNHALARTFARMAPDMPRPDIIFCCLPTLEMAYQSISFARHRGIPILIDIRDQWPDIYLKPFPRPMHGLARLMLSTEFNKMRSICRGATGITAVSQTYFDWALNYAGREQGMHDGVFPLGYPATTGQATTALDQRARELQDTYGIRSDALVISFVGIFGMSYDLETVVEAAKRLHTQGTTQVQFVLAGDGDKGERIRNLARGIDTVIFPGWLDERSIHALLKLSSIGLAPYVKGALQSLPNKPFEYMAAGLPILSSLQGELETLITNEQIGKQYQPGNPQSLVDQVQWLLDHPETCHAMGKRSRRLLEERFRTETVYARLADHLDHVARKA